MRWNPVVENWEECDALEVKGVTYSHTKNIGAQTINIYLKEGRYYGYFFL
jgi:hypothetical protein